MVDGKIGAYLRKSTAEQQTDGQRFDVTRWLENHGVDPATVQWFEDTDHRETLDRDGLRALRSAIFQGTVKTVVVADVTRLAATIVDGVNLLHNWLSAGCRLVSVRQEFDFSGGVGMMIASLLFGLSQTEMETRRKRQAAGIAAAKAAGKYTGRVSGTRKADASRAAELRQRGLTDTEIAAALHVTRRTIQRYLHG